MCLRAIPMPKEVVSTELTDPHHAAIHNTDGNRRNYPLIINSAVVIEEVHRACHDSHPGFGHWTDAKAEAVEGLYRQFVALVEEHELTGKELRGTGLDFKRMWEERG